MRDVKKEVAAYKAINTCFQQQLLGAAQSHKNDLVFEFQQWMLDEITEAQKRVASSNKFTFFGDGAANESGHIASLINQLKLVLFDVRAMAQGYQAEAGVSQLRKCPYCGAVWAKLAGCDDGTTCGNRMNQIGGRSGTLMHFNFRWDGKHLAIAPAEQKSVTVSSRNNVAGWGAGCGRSIVWKDMAPVSVPDEFRTEVGVNIHTKDVEVVPDAAKRGWGEVFKGVSGTKVVAEM